MFKLMMTLWRGKQAEAVEALADAHALTLLDQQIRDATADLERARRAFAIASALDDADLKRVEATKAKIGDLETRALAALDGAREDLAAEAADAIAALEADLASANGSRAGFSAEAAKLKANIVNAERRLAELERGRRAAHAAEAVRRLRSRGSDAHGGGDSALREAEATLKRLRERQMEDEAATNALESVTGSTGADAVASKLENAGFGDATRPTGRAVLERLKQRRQAA